MYANNRKIIYFSAGTKNMYGKRTFIQEQFWNHLLLYYRLSDVPGIVSIMFYNIALSTVHMISYTVRYIAPAEVINA